jgi:hypothetical protein
LSSQSRRCGIFRLRAFPQRNLLCLRASTSAEFRNARVVAGIYCWQADAAGMEEIITAGGLDCIYRKALCQSQVVGMCV